VSDWTGTSGLVRLAHVPGMPGAEVTEAPVMGLVGVAALPTAAGLTGFRPRDLLG
jgi:hypothetical protein